ncbi:MAG: type IV pilus assembly protein PilW [Gammaproteobacteria bacterium]|jgi:type IV pilus assembly protein PilW
MNRTQQQGFTIVELMVAATLGLLILGGAISMFVSNKRVYTEQDEMGRLQENARFAMDMLIRDIRMAGHTGCGDELDDVMNHVNGAGTATTLYAFTPIEGSEAAGTWRPSTSTEEQSDMQTDMPIDSDAITLRYFADTETFSMQPANDAANIEIYTSADSEIRRGDIIAISDCASADIVVATTDASTSTPACISTGPTDTCLDTFEHKTGTIAGADPGNATQVLSKNYDSEATILRYVTNRYFIGNDLDGNPVLHRKSGVDNAEEMIEGVENMQILYGEDTTGADQVADIYRDANSVADWDDVVSVRVALLMRTVRQYGSDINNDTYNLLGVTINPTDDRRRRRVFTTTVQIRNRRS